MKESIGILIIAYMIFVLLSEQAHPLHKPKSNQARRRRKFGIGFSVAFLISAAFSAMVFDNKMEAQLVGTLIGTLVLASPCILHHLKSSSRKKLLMKSG